MATEEDVRRIALALPEVVELPDRLRFVVMNKGKEKGVVWSWLERIDPKKGRVENRSVVAIRVADLEEKELLLTADEGKFFTEPHYNGYPAVLVRLAAIGADELEGLIVEAWRCQAPKELVRHYEAQRAASTATSRPG